MESLEQHHENGRLFQEKIESVGYIGLTKEDHESVQSTPEEIQTENPGKTLGELWSDEEIKNYLQKLKDFLEEEDGDTREWWINYRKDQAENFEASKRYLESIGRLPEGF